MYKFKVESLSCMSCFHNIEDALKEYDEGISAKADVRSRVLTVEASVPKEKIKELIENAGYPVTDVTN